MSDRFETSETARPHGEILDRAFRALTSLAKKALSGRTAVPLLLHIWAGGRKLSPGDGPIGLKPPEPRLPSSAPEALLSHLGPDRDRARLRYEDLRGRLVRYFEWRGVEDPECLADETLSRAARQLAQGIAPPSLPGFVYAVAHRVTQEMYRDNRPRMMGEISWTAREQLTLEHLEAILARLSPDREQAGVLYEDIRRRLIRYFDDWQLGVRSESLADVTIDRVARRLAQGAEIHLERPLSYFLGVAYRVALEAKRVPRPWDQEPHTLIVVQPSTQESEIDPRLPCLRRCLDRLPANERDLILRYYDGEDRISGRQRLAQELRIGHNALRIRAHRVRRKLAGCCFHCLEAAAYRDDGGSTEGFPEEG